MSHRTVSEHSYRIFPKLGAAPAVRCAARRAQPGCSASFANITHTSRCLLHGGRALGGFACPGSAVSTERDRWAVSRRTRNAWCLVPAGTGGYAHPMEISPKWGNFPCLCVQVPPRTQALWACPGSICVASSPVRQRWTSLVNGGRTDYELHCGKPQSALMIARDLAVC
jgi:hypothetical protein